MSVDIDQLLQTGAMTGPYRSIKRVRRSRIVETLRALAAFLLQPNPWGVR